ncbi:beta-galactosidase [Streptomyces sp. SAI-135]|jgi:beta-galactosidase|uniref:beta-galactosidase n=1 Tax=unclassified Streptomyces TaxID=2593676 RepID=UPI00247304CD|nr:MULTISPECIES: beta-galactosidase [unclassified Streptomyces]MDH6521912.1 beta-galactosidase [Streptomyces sp. SAI-090]MDH6573281.1 beta-galactosidase [Streptomyces sp. SAI-117]MDH6613986.1 beta-galactosidase [Streptomyces sp. SAI-135]
MAVLPARVLFGAAYYHEYTPAYGGIRPDEQLKADLDLMADAHFTVIRVGESVWSTWEPTSGRFDLDWLQPVLDGAHERGISVILGTPTYAVPPWLSRQYPEITGENATGRRLGWGARQEVDITHPAFRFHAERVIRKITGRYADHPAVIGWQVDNEPGLHLLHNHGVFQRFVDHLREKYGDVETLNREWGLVYWSHRLSTWADLWTPDGNEQPQYDVAWRQFQADQVTEFIGWQADIVREYAHPEQFVTTCISYTRSGVEDDELAARLDIASGNPYYDMQDGLLLPDPTPDDHEQIWKTTGVWSMYQTADWMFSSGQKPFLVTETNAQSIGFAWDNQPGYDGQWRQAAWAHVARGARMIEYWQWQTLRFGAETYWGGVLPHSGRPGRAYAEIARLGAEFDKAGPLVAGLEPDADITMVYSTPSKWLMQKYPPLSKPDGSPDPAAYHRIFDPFYRGAFDAGRQVRIVHSRQLHDPSGEQDGMAPEDAARRHPVLVVPALYLAHDATLDWFEAYARAGGHLVLGPRTAYADHEARARHEPAPGRLSEAAGVAYEEFSNLLREVPVQAVAGSPLPLGEDATATRWLEALTVDDAEVLAAYDDRHFGRWPAVTSRRHGAGRVTCVGTVPGRSLARALAGWLVPAPRSGWQDLPVSVTATTGTATDGRRVHVIHNWSWEPARVTAPQELTDVLDDALVSVGTAVDLGAWDVRVFATTGDDRPASP